MRRVKVNLADVVDAFDNGFPELHYYLDCHTGDVVMVSDEARLALERVDEVMNGGKSKITFEEALQQANPLYADEDELRVAEAVEAGFGTRFIEIPRRGSHEGYRDMELFIETVDDRHLQNRLQHAIDGRGAFRRFKDTLIDYPTERERWFAFEQERAQRRALEWLAAEQIEPVEN